MGEVIVGREAHAFLPILSGFVSRKHAVLAVKVSDKKQQRA